MAYFSYHATAKKLLREGKLSHFYFTADHKGIRPALVLIFRDEKHPLMPIRQHKWEEYLPFLLKNKKSR